MRHLPALGVVFAAAAAIGLSAQQPQFQVEVRLVEVEARVTDRDGQPLSDLQRHEFQLREDDVPHEVANAIYVAPTARNLPVPADMRTPDGPAFVTVEPPPTWVVVAAEASISDVPRVHEAVRRFVMSQLRPGFRVSVAGYPFTDDRTTLLQRVDSLVREPFGSDGRPGLVDASLQSYADAADERAAASEFRKQEEGMETLQGFVMRPERVETNASLARPMFITEGRIERQMPMYGDVALARYEEMVTRLGRLPGKKIVVLFRPGLRIEADNSTALRRVASLAARGRVSFYVADSRGLNAVVPAEEKQIPFFVDRRQRQWVDVFGKLNMQAMSENGLSALANETHGRVVLDSNRLADIFDAVVRDSSGYYVLGYHPLDLSTEGKYRRLKVSVTRPGAKVVAHTRGYYEADPTRPWGGGDKDRDLRRALLADLPSDLPVVASSHVFAVATGTPALVLTAGITAGALEAREEKTAPRLAATALVRVSSDDPQRMPLYYERRLGGTLTPEDWRAARVDRTAALSVTDVIMLPAGYHTWRVVVKDDHSGRLGGVEGSMAVPDFSRGAASSSLLMTGDVLRRGEAPDAIADDVLDAGTLRYAPQALRVFKQGTRVHLLFDAYNPGAEALAAASQPGPRVGLLRSGRPVAGLVVHGEAFPDPARRRIRYVATLETAHLEPGQYTVLAAPALSVSPEKPLVQIFQLIPAS